MTPTKILSAQQLIKLQSDLTELLERNGLTACYMVAEARSDDQRPAEYATVAFAKVEGYNPTPLLIELGKQTYMLMRGAGIPAAPNLSDN